MRHVLALARKWLYLLLLACVIGGVAGFAVNLFLPKTYEADTTLYISTPNHSDYNTVLGDQQAAKALANFTQSTSVLQATLRVVGVRGLSLPQLASMITVDNSLDSQFVVIRVRDSDPRLAARLATVLTEQSMNKYEASSTDGGKLQFVKDEIDRLGNEIMSLENLLTSLQGQGQGVSINDPTVKAARISQLTDQLNGLRQLYIELFNTEMLTGATPFLLQQINTVQTEINNLETILAALQGRGTSSNDPSLQSVRITQLQDELNGLRQMYVPLINSYGNLTSPQITLLQEAQVPQKPVGAGSFVAIAIGMLVGLIAIIGVIIFIEQIDDILRSPSKVEKATGLRTLITVRHLHITTTNQAVLLNGYHPENEDTITLQPFPAKAKSTHFIEDQRQILDDTAKRLAIATRQIQSVRVDSSAGRRASTRFQVPETFLTLGVLLRGERSQLTSSSNNNRSLLISSPEDGDGKTLIASQLALGLARVGVEVVLVDANLYKPEIHSIFGLSNSTGLSSILSSNQNGDSTSHLVDRTFGALQETHEPKLSILTSGPTVDSSPEILSSERMKAIINLLSEKAFVIIDGPAVLTSSESVILANKSDGIIIVVDARHTTASKLNLSLEMLMWVNTNILGVVLNQVSKGDEN